MKTKKVFGSLKGIIVSFAFAIFGIGTGIHSSNHTLLICGSIFGIWTIFILYFLFYPIFSYNDECLIRADLLKGWGGTEKVEWKDILSIITDGYSSITLIRLKGGNIIPMNFLITPNYLQVLAEIVELVRKNNPRAVVSEETAKRLEEGYKQKTTILISCFNAFIYFDVGNDAISLVCHLMLLVHDGDPSWTKKSDIIQ